MAAVAFLDITGSYLPRSAAELVELDRALGLRTSLVARDALALVAVVVALLVRGVWRGQRRAWAAAVMGGAASGVLQVLRDATWPAATMCAIVTVGLLADHRSYRVPGRAIRAAWLLVPAVAVAALAFGAFGWLEHADGLPDLSLAARARVVVRGMLFLSPGVTGSTRSARAFLDVLPIGGAAVAVVAAVALFLRVRPDRSGVAERADAERFFAERGRTSSAALATMPGNELVTVGDGVVAGVRFFAGVTAVVGPPVSADADDERALIALVERCAHWGTVPAVLDADADAAAAGARVGFAALKIGEEAFVDLAGFSLAGKARANVRHSATRAERDGVHVIRYDSTARSSTLDRNLKLISDAWLAAKHGPELGFTLGRFDPDRLDAQEVYAAVGADGTAVAFVTWLPYDGRRAALLDLMRRAELAPPGVMELLISRSLEDFAARGLAEASLGGVPLASTSERVGPLDRALGWAFERGGAVYEAKGLFAFKRKFDPRWEPMFLLYPTGTDLPRIAAAVGRAFLPPGLAALRGWLPRRR